jgi:hypothetical protein
VGARVAAAPAGPQSVCPKVVTCTFIGRARRSRRATRVGDTRVDGDSLGRTDTVGHCLFRWVHVLLPHQAEIAFDKSLRTGESLAIRSWGRLGGIGLGPGRADEASGCICDWTWKHHERVIYV